MRARLIQPALIASLATLALVLLLEPPRPAPGQASGNVQLATAYQKFSIVLNGTTIITAINANIGQTSHVLQYQFVPSNSAKGCVFLFDASNDGTNWRTLAAFGDASVQLVTNPPTVPQIVQAAGYFPFLRLKSNPTGNATCTGETLNLTYTGSQTALPAPVGFFPAGMQQANYPPSAVCALYQACGASQTSFSQPYIVGGLNCVNTTASVAYVNLYDYQSATAPAGGSTTLLLLSVQVPANGGTFVYSGAPIIGAHQLWMSGTTTFGGTVGVGVSAMMCDPFLNAGGPFFPLFPPSS